MEHKKQKALDMIENIKYNKNIKNMIIQTIREQSIKLSDQYSDNIKIEINTNKKLKSTSVKITECIK